MKYLTSKKHKSDRYTAAQRNQIYTCKTCGQKITWWNKDDGIPLNLSDGKTHRCKLKVKVFKFNKNEKMTLEQFNRLVEGEDV